MSPPATADRFPNLAVDHTDRLPDPLLLLILNRIGDVKSLGRCSLLSRRFRSLVPLVDSIIVRVDCVVSDDPAPPAAAALKPRGIFSQLSRLVARPFHALGQILIPTPTPNPNPIPADSEISHHSPTEVLKSFRELRHLRIELPVGELSVDDGVFLKWKAEFGSSLSTCAVIGASSVTSSPCSTSGAAITSDGDSLESFYTDGSLKMRVIWTISSLIAASARHYLLQPIIADHHDTLQSLELMDVDGQGALTMDWGQLQEVQVCPATASGASHRTQLPALTMRLWYAPHLELPSGVVFKGATLVAIWPSEGPLWDSDGCWSSGVFDEPYQTAARMLQKQRGYCLEMNSF